MIAMYFQIYRYFAVIVTLQNHQINMARKERNSVDYFPHSVSHGKKMFYLRSKYKNDGYAVWFMLLEELGRAEYHYLDLSDEVQIMYLSAQFMVSEEILKEIIESLVSFGEFDKELWQSKILFNDKFIDNISDAYKKRGNECINKESLRVLLTSKGILFESKSDRKHPKSTSKGAGNTQRIEEDSILKESKEEDSIILYLNEVTNSSFKSDSKNSIKHISARLKEKFILQDFYDVIDHKFYNWGADPKMKEYLRPETLFGNKFESYLQAARAQPIKVLNPLEITALNIQKAKENLGL